MRGAAAAGAPGERLLAGIALMVLAVALLTAMDGIAKVLMRSLPVAEIVWARYAGNLIALLAVLPAFRVAVWRTREGPLQLLRSVMMVAAAGLMFLALSLMPMAETYAVNYLLPLLVAAMAGAWLGERVGPRRSLALAAASSACGPFGARGTRPPRRGYGVCGLPTRHPPARARAGG